MTYSEYSNKKDEVRSFFESNTDSFARQKENTSDLESVEPSDLTDEDVNEIVDLAWSV